MNVCFFGHKWKKWSEVYHFTIREIDGKSGKKIATQTQNRQRRICERCGLIEERRID